MDITQKEAVFRGLPGSDTYIYRHLIYKDDLNRDFGSAYLNVEAYRIFLDAIWISKYPQIAEEINTVIKNKFLTFTPLLWKTIEYQNLENFKIAAGFELAFKAILLRKNCIINLIKKIQNFEDLSKQQWKRPILREEYFTIDDYRYDAQKCHNKLIGIQEGSIKFSTILDEKDYINLLDMPEEIINIANNYRNLRNEIHFPGISGVFELNSNAHDILINKIINFINENLVEVNETIVAQHDLHKNLLLQKLQF
jgi:hypothetical protein